MIVLNNYNNSFNVYSNLLKYKHLKTGIKEDYDNETPQERLAYVYSGKNIDIKDPSGILLLNSGSNFKTNKLNKIENKEFTKMVEDIYNRDVFKDIAQKTQGKTPFVNFNGQINFTTNQKTKTFSSIHDIKKVYDNFNTLRENSGHLFIFDTETIGGKSQAGIWNPLGITEFAMQDVDLATNDYKATNIVMGIVPTEQNRRVKEQILKLMRAGKWDEIEKNEELFITAKRVGLYATADIDYSGDYATITKLPSAEDVKWKNADTFEEGWKALEKAHKKSKMTATGMRASDAAFLESIVTMQTALNNRTGMLMGQNFQIFDEKVINNQLRQMQHTYQQIAQGTEEGIRLSNLTGIKQGQAKTAIKHIDQTLQSIGGGFTMYNDLTFDTLPFFNIARDYFGVDPLFNYNQRMIKEAMGGTAKQEYIGEAWFPDLFKGNNAHMADFDVTVLRYLATMEAPGRSGQTVMDHIMNSMGIYTSPSRQHENLGIYGIDDVTKQLQEGQVFYVKNGVDKRYQGKTLLNFTYNEKTGEVFTNSGYNFVNGKSMGYNKTDINMGTNLKKGQFYRIEQIKKVKAEDISKNLGLINPDMSGTEFIHVQFKMQLPNEHKNNDLQYLSYNMLFNSEKEVAGFFSSDMKLSLEKDEQGVYHIAQGASDLFKWITDDGKGNQVSLQHAKNLDEQGIINEALYRSTNEFISEKAYSGVLESDKAHKKVKQMLDAQKYLEKQGINNVSQKELNNLIDNKKIRNLTDERTKVISEKLNNIFGFYSKNIKEQTLYSNTQRSIVASWNTVTNQKEFFTTVLTELDEVAKQKKYNDKQKNFVFQELVEAFRITAAAGLNNSTDEEMRKNVNNSIGHLTSEYEKKRYFDFRLPDSFNKEQNHVVDVSSMTNPAKYKNVIRVDLQDSSASYKLVNQLRAARYGDKEMFGGVDVYNRKAFTAFMQSMNKEYGNDKWFRNLYDQVKKSNDYNVNAMAREVIDFMNAVKKRNSSNAFIKEFDYKSLSNNIAMNKKLNSIGSEQVRDMLSNKIIDPIDSKKLIKSKDAMKDFVNDNLMKHYMPSMDDFDKSLKSLTDLQKWQKGMLYDSLYEDISAQLQDILSMTTRIENAETYIDKAGDIIVYKGGKAVRVASIPKVELKDNGLMVGKLGRQKFHLHLNVGVDENGQLSIKNNLGEKFANNKRTSNMIRRELKEGTFKLESIYKFTNYLSKDFMEEATYAGTSGEIMNNFLVNINELDSLLPKIFKENGSLNYLLDKMNLPEEVVDLMKDIPDEIKPGKLDPARRQMISAYTVSILRTLEEEMVGDTSDVRKIIEGLVGSTKDKSKLGKGTYMGANFRYRTGFTDPLDENSRPVITGAGNVYYLDAKNVAKAVKESVGTMYAGALFDSDLIEQINVVDKKYGNQAITSFTGRIAYINQIGIDKLLDDYKDDILEKNKHYFKSDEQAEEVYEFLHSFLNTFEQAKVLDTETFDKITNGAMAANIQTLSSSRDIISAMENNSDTKTYKDLWDLRGTVEFDKDGNIKYKSSVGKILKHGEAVVPYEAYGGTQENWVNNMYRGLLRYTVRNEEGMFVSDDVISQILTDHKDRFTGIDAKNKKELARVVEEIFDEIDYKAAYTIEDINKTTLPKLLANNAEKSMNQVAYMRIGTIDPRVAGVLKDYSDETAELIGRTVPTRQALEAYFRDQRKAEAVLTSYKFKTIDEFIDTVFMESYAANKMIFGKDGLFAGFTAIGNDNIPGHKNKGSLAISVLDEAITMLGKWSSKNIIEDDVSRQMGLERFVDIVNNSTYETTDSKGNKVQKDFRFYRNSQTGEGYELEVVDGHLRIKGGADLKDGFIDFDLVDVDRAEQLVRHIDDIIVKEATARNISLDDIKNDRLVHTEIDDEGNPIEYVARMLYDKDGNIVSSTGMASMKLVKDSETQSSMTAEYKEAKEKLVELKDRQREMRKQITKAGGLVPDEALEKMHQMDLAVESMESHIRDLKGTGHYYKLGDREIAILRQQNISRDLFAIMDRDINEGHYTRQTLEENEAYRAFDRSRVEDKDEDVFGFLERNASERRYYSPLDEKELTKDMLKEEKYAKYKDIYHNIVETQGYKLGVDNAEELYNLQSMDMAKDFNAGKKVSIKDMEAHGFEVISPQEYWDRYGDVDVPEYETLVKSNVVIDLGDEFEYKNRFIAVAGTGSVVGDAEIKRPWHRSAGSLVKTYLKDYETTVLQGDETSKKKIVERLMEQRKQVVEDSANYVKKKGPVHNWMQFEIETPLTREKLLTVPDSSPLFETAQVHGKSLKYWRDRGINYDAVWHDEEHFRKAGYFSDKMKAKLGVKTDEEMIEYLQTYGDAFIDDRYPNIYQTSIVPTRHYMFKPDQVRSINATYTTQETALKLKGDSDGDSLTSISMVSKDTTFIEYNMARNKAIEMANQKQFADNIEREAFIKQQTLGMGIDEIAYDDFVKVDFRQFAEATIENQVWHDRVEKTKADEAIRVKKTQAIYNSKDGRVAELIGGKSILGREKYTALGYDPSLTEIEESIDNVNSILQVVRDHSDKLDNTSGKYDIILKNTFGILEHEGDENAIMDVALQGIEELANKGEFGDDSAGKSFLEGMENVVRQRVRMNSYHNELMSKLGITAVGNVNAAFYGATQAAKAYLLPKESRLHNAYAAEVLSVMGTEIEQASISSKHAQIKAGDGRVVSLGNVLNSIQRDGLGDMDDDNSNYSLLKGWLESNMDQKTMVNQYKNIARRIDLGDKLIDWSTDEGKKQIADSMIKTTIETYDQIYRNPQTAQYAKAFKLLGTGSSNVDSMRILMGMDTNSNAGKVVAAIKNYTKQNAGFNTSGGGPGPKTTSQTIGGQTKQAIRTALNAQQTSAHSLRKITSRVAQIEGGGVGMALGLAVVGLASGLIAAGYASGNPLNDAQPENVTEQPSTVQQAGPTFSTTPGMAPNNTGGYIINIKGDTKEGNRQLKKAMKKAAKASTGGGVNINMSLRTSQQGGYTDKDIENILSEYI